jgi:hypothetical protein
MIPFLLKLTRTEWDAEKQGRAAKAILALVHNMYHPASCAKPMKPQELTKFTNLLKGWEVRSPASHDATSAIWSNFRSDLS